MANNIIKIYEGLNSESMLGNGKVDRKIIKYFDGTNEYIIVDGEDEVYVCFKDFTINEQGFRRDFINTKKITKEEFNKLI